jgi:hypothetical protein
MPTYNPAMQKACLAEIKADEHAAGDLEPFDRAARAAIALTRSQYPA